MCGHYERYVKNALEAIERVREANPDHKTEKAYKIIEKEVSNKAMKTEVEYEEYSISE